MKVKLAENKKVRIEMVPLIDTMFLLLVYFIYAMLSMAVHKGLPVVLPASSTAAVEKHLILSVTVKADGAIFVDKQAVTYADLTALLRSRTGGELRAGVLLFADRSLSYQNLFRVLDQIRKAGIRNISLQAEAVR
jgi:biopolymer transport protein ExbD